MKKIFVLIICLVVLIGGALAEIDLDTLSVDELQELYLEIGQKLYGEKLASEDGGRLPYGTYIIGVDIPEGSYVLSATTEVADNYSTFIRVNDENGRPVLLEDITNGRKDVVLNNLKSGYELYISTYSQYEHELRIRTLSTFLNMP